MKNRAIIVLFILCIGMCSIYGNLEVKQIVSHSTYLGMPSIYGDKIVWLEERNMKNDIFLYDISKGEERKVSNSGCCQNPVIYGNKIVWADGRMPGNRDIYLYDLSKEEEIRITDNPSIQISPKIYGDKIVWIDFRNGTGFTDNSDIYMYDISTGEEKRITQKSCGCRNVAIYGDKIVWEQEMWKEKDEIWKPGYLDHDIYLYDLSTEQQRRITDDPIDQYNPVIYGNRIIWREIESKGFLELSEYRQCLYDLSTNKKKTIASGPGGSVAIYKDKIIWYGSKNGKSGIFLYDIPTGKEKVVTYDYWGGLAMYENTIVWACLKGVYSDMYFCSIDEASLPTITPLPTTTTPVATTSAPMTTSPPTTLPQTKSTPIISSQNSSYSLYLGILGGILIFLVIAIPLLTLSKRKSEKIRDIKKDTQKEDLMTLLSKKYLDGKITKEQYLKFKKKIKEM